MAVTDGASDGDSRFAMPSFMDGDTQFVRATTPDGGVATLTDHESVGGRFEPDGSFRGTWTLMTLECDPATDESVAKKSEQRPPSETEVAALRRLADEVLRRVRS